MQAIFLLPLSYYIKGRFQSALPHHPIVDHLNYGESLTLFILLVPHWFLAVGYHDTYKITALSVNGPPPSNSRSKPQTLQHHHIPRRN
jgi:hypothetical protein